ncbi:hypothetical protein Gasu2_50520 [Galdieria sulphuraria]|uniref:Uncharacterized protein n=1 Tax=Galdieria sulphuraria TaxID=130081 RepID=M2X3P3_GALSU|nr:uncharacterized protein Gasu_17980 [Galdieria sulphuraria]EME31040.1 hypothetical protein Gasu_17980 [Galdieria sulphuraria]GJD09315.1 hypothetical protein Gasu2_35720 [Galdieria sulphuraria]GJD10885.1 hypothetical protein Gasu2_50520 [Galdieria sulphuraria]|eukprot:XP_005707560.1 hypothetical protein Gasu_17980 [Galdieria sulphuraria]
MSSNKRIRETVEMESNNSKISKSCLYENTSTALLKLQQNSHPFGKTEPTSTTSHSLLENSQPNIPQPNLTNNTLERYFQVSYECTSSLETHKEPTPNNCICTYSSCVICLGSHSTYYQTCERCFRNICNFCSRRCDECIGVFCMFCSIVNYQYRFERTQCMDCQNIGGV